MKKTLLDVFLEGLQPYPPIVETMEHFPLFRYPINYGHTMPQLDLIRSFDGHYLLEWLIPGQTNIHIIKTITKEDLQKLFLDTPLGNLTLFDIFNPANSAIHNNLRIGPINDNKYYERAIFQLIDRHLVKDRLETIVNQPLISPNNVVSPSIQDIKSMLQ